MVHRSNTFGLGTSPKIYSDSTGQPQSMLIYTVKLETCSQIRDTIRWSLGRSCDHQTRHYICATEWTLYYLSTFRQLHSAEGL